MTDQVLVALFEREEDLVGAAAAARARGLAIVDAYAPYEVHGLDKALGFAPSRLPLVCFALGLLGAASILVFQFWTSAVSWATNVGGRPWNSLPAFVPITFEVTVLFAGAGTVIAFIIVSGLRPWRRQFIPDPRVTDDRFALVLENANGLDRAGVEALLGRFHPESIALRAAGAEAEA